MEFVFKGMCCPGVGRSGIRQMGMLRRHSGSAGRSADFQIHSTAVRSSDLYRSGFHPAVQQVTGKQIQRRRAKRSASNDGTVKNWRGTRKWLERPSGTYHQEPVHDGTGVAVNSSGCFVSSWLRVGAVCQLLNRQSLL